MLFRKKQKEVFVTDQPIEKLIPLSTNDFHNMIVEYESGKMDEQDILIFFSYIVENEKWERCRYRWLLELMDYGVILDNGMINPYKLKEYKLSKPTT